ncbi:uncharacterized protein LOC136031348 [Artemia franciscana]|uniref:uncharacterized protein LOC136031348 n=1 Tax=Artemia franciscana TaxID=6661 RepID=UPI0032DA0430
MDSCNSCEFGYYLGVERISQQNFVVVLNEEEHQENCLPLIQRYVKPGSVIYSEILDESGYLSSLGYVHITVNYSENNVTELGSIKKLQRAIKIHIKRVESTGKDMNHHIARFKFISSIKNKKELLHQFFTEVGKCYPPFSNKRNRNFYQGNTDSDKQLTICKETNSDEEFIEFSQRDDDEELAGTDSD